MKIALVGFNAAIAPAVGAIDGSIYPEQTRQAIFDSMANGIFLSPTAINAADKIVAREDGVNVCVPGDLEEATLVKRLRRVINDVRRSRIEAERHEHPQYFDAELLRHITLPKDLPRSVRCGPITYEDWTPFCFFANPRADLRISPVNLVPFERAALDGVDPSKGDDVALKVTKYAHNRWVELEKTGVEQRMKYSFHPMKETGFAFLLPPTGYKAPDGRENTTGTDIIMFGTELFKKFATALVRHRMKRVDDVRNREDAIAHAYMMRQDYSVWTASVQQVFKDPKYAIKLTGLEERALAIFQDMTERYMSFIEKHARKMLDNKCSDFAMSMKPLKSPATDIIAPSGDRFDKRESYYYPDAIFDVGHHEHNAYAQFSYLPLKSELIPTIVPSEVKRMEGLKKGLLHDPSWEFSMVMQGCAREGTVAWRINAPDKPRFWKRQGGDYVPDESRETYVPEWDSDDWVLCQGKPREVCHEVSPAEFVTRFVHPIDCCEYIKKNQATDYDRSNQDVKQTRFDKAGMLLRARLIMPHKWRFNMFDGTIAKLFAVPLEHCRVGFPSLKVGSAYEQLFRSEVPKGNSVPWAFDVSHYETFSSSNPELMCKMFGTNKMRSLFFEDAASGWLAGAFGRRYHRFQTSSGIGCTTLFSLIPGMFINGMDVAYRNDGDENDILNTCSQLWKKLYGEAIDYAISHYGIQDDNPFGSSFDFPTYKWRGKTVTSLIHCGSDDQGGWDRSDTLTREEIEHAINSDTANSWRTRCHSSLELGAGSHFGIVRTSDGFERDETSADWKWCFSERKAIGDLIALGATVAFQTTPGLEEDVQAALDEIGGGSTYAYWIGAKVANAILMNNTEFCKNIIDNYYPEESPSGKRISDKLAESGFAVGKSNALPEEVTREIVDTYLSFVQGGQNE